MPRFLGGGFYRGRDYGYSGRDHRHKFIPSKKDAETCTFCGGSKKLQTQREPHVPVHTDNDPAEDE